MMANNTQQSTLKNFAMELIVWLKIAATEVGETIASNRLGQIIIKQADKTLWMIEKSLQWSLPTVTYGEDENIVQTDELIRPLPWILFLPVLLMLRCIRETLSIGALIIGKEQIQSQDFIKFIQSTRRSLRAIKYQGLRNMRSSSLQAINQKEDAKSNGYLTNFYLIILDKVKSLFYFKSVRYSSSTNRQTIVRKNESENAQANTKDSTKKKLPNGLDDSVTILRDFVAKIDEFLESDSSDSDFSYNGENEKCSDNSGTSDEEEILDPENKDVINGNNQSATTSSASATTSSTTISNTDSGTENNQTDGSNTGNGTTSGQSENSSDVNNSSETTINGTNDSQSTNENTSTSNGSKATAENTNAITNGSDESTTENSGTTNSSEAAKSTDATTNTSDNSTSTSQSEVDTTNTSKTNSSSGGTTDATQSQSQNGTTTTTISNGTEITDESTTSAATA